MLIAVCNICRKQLGDQPEPHFCDRCMPFAAEFFQEQQKAYSVALERLKHTMEKFRNDFLQNRVLGDVKLKVVQNAS